MSAVDERESRTDAAIAARRCIAEAMLQRVSEQIRLMQRDHVPVTTAAVARRARVSRTFLYQNSTARRLVLSATSETSTGRVDGPRVSHSDQELWRDRALNAEHELKRSYDEVMTQRARIGDLLGRIRDLENDLPDDGVQRVLTDNHTLKHHILQLERDNTRLDERLAGARDNNRFLDRRVADLEARLLDSLGTGRADGGAASTNPGAELK